METKYDPDIHHRRSIRLYGYDYSCKGLYFITICCQDRMCLFGKIVDDEMVLNEAGRIAEEEWLHTIDIRSGNVALHDFVIMPNHMHAIVEIIQLDSLSSICELSDTRHTFFPGDVCDTALSRQSPSNTLGAIVRGYKAAVSRKLGFSVWQRNYFEHVIRNNKSYQNISEYIITNPNNWKGDDLYMNE